MNNLLRTLTETQVRPVADLKLLLTAVKETRRQSYDTRLSDAFYDSLENLLADLRTITIDNRDAEAFLKPVSRSEVPDYYEYITNPMDLATMGKKVKNKQYKSKREFKDDLDLIWSNCHKYNAAEDHPLRQCATRLKVKAERLLKHITDRKDRTDPPIPFELVPQAGIARPKLNGMANGHTRSPSLAASTPTANGKLQSRRVDLPFSESPALIRTGSGMVQFRELDRGLTDLPDDKVVQKLKELVPHIEPEGDENRDDLSMALEGVTGDKRKLNGVSDSRPRKRARFATLPDDLSQLWWHAVQTDNMIANGLPEIPYASSSQHTLSSAADKKPKRRKRKTPEKPSDKSLLTLMNNNIKAMRRVRQTHTKLAALVASTAGPEDPDSAGDGGFSGGPSASLGTAGVGPGFSSFQPPAPDDDVGDENLDERHWLDRVKTKRKGGLEIGEDNSHSCMTWVGEKVLEHAGFQGTSKGALDLLAGVGADYLLNVGRTIRFLCDRYSQTMSPEEIILHTLFESGISKIQELERFISDDIERYGSRVLELEKKLVGVYRDSTSGQEALEDEGLFEEEEEEEAGALAIGDFADSLGEDYLGLRELGIADEFGLTSLAIPKTLLRRKKAQKPAIAKPAEKPLDYPLPPPFLPFTYPQVENQIGLLKPYYRSRFEQLAAARAPSTAPVLAHPQPPHSLPTALPGPSLPGPSLTQLYPPKPYPTPINGPQTVPASQPSAPAPPPAPVIPPDLVLPDDPIHPYQAKMGPLGQITKPNVTSTTTKKKVKLMADDAGGGGAGGGPGATFIPTVVGPNGFATALGPDGLPKKKKGPTGVGSGNGRKKKDSQPPSGGLALPMSSVPSQTSSSGGYPGQGQGQGSPFPAIVAASA